MKDKPPPRSSKARSKQEIAALYEMDPRTLSAKIIAAGIELPKGLLTPKQQKVIFELMGYPNEQIMEVLRHI